MRLCERLPSKTIDFPIAWTGGIYIGGLPKNNGASRQPTDAKPSASLQMNAQHYHPRRRK
jgi:hypothetical protein